MATLLKTKTEFISDDGLLSVRDWLAMGETKPHYELIDGKLVQKPMKTYRQCRAVGSFLSACINQLEASGWQFFIGGTSVYVSEYTGLIPDAVGFAPGAELDPEAEIEGAPFAVLELAPPVSIAEQHIQKRRDYARIGVEVYILIDPTQKTMEVFRLKGNRYSAPRNASATTTCGNRKSCRGWNWNSASCGRQPTRSSESFYVLLDRRLG